MWQWGSSMLYTCFGFDPTTTREDDDIPNYKARLLEYSISDKKKDEDRVLHVIEKMMKASSFYHDFDCVIREFKNLKINNIWLYAVPRTGNEIVLIPMSNFGKRNVVKVFFGTKEEFLVKIQPKGELENLELLRDAGFLLIK